MSDGDNYECGDLAEENFNLIDDVTGDQYECKVIERLLANNFQIRSSLNKRENMITHETINHMRNKLIKQKNENEIHL